MKGTHPRRLAVAVVAAAAVALAACGGPTTQGVASLNGSRGGGQRPGGSDSAGTHSAATTRPGGTPSDGTATRLVDQWATCMRRHGDADQADPTIDSHWVIHVSVPATPGAGRQAHTGLGACSRYLAEAQNDLRAAHPVAPPPDQAELLTYVGCMRANGVPDYPDPTASTPNSTNFNGTGVTPTSPAVMRVSRICGRELNLPAWWIAGTGPPGDVDVTTTGSAPRGAPVPTNGGAGPHA